ncbi:hypothetical protein [uncultured Cellulomonas sp.]|uniref:hypothetical protein n=1 Tax=uncultured Cellulomonas sp. TaxID=189682 RepID=UPI002605AC07|nr:hypothetical protein [uncultured Cellulomonas sp.]
MTRSAQPANAQPTFDLGVDASAGAVGGVVHDTLGMPMSLRAAKAMTRNSIRSALDRTLAKLHHDVVPGVGAGDPIDSMEVVFLIGRFYRDLDRKQLDLSKVRRSRWSSLEGVADVLHEEMKELR